MVGLYFSVSSTFLFHILIKIITEEIFNRIRESIILSSCTKEFNLKTDESKTILVIINEILVEN